MTISHTTPQPAKVMIVKLVRLDPQQPVTVIDKWLKSNCVGEAGITWTNMFTDYKTKTSIHLTVEVEFAESDDAALFMMRWS